MKEENLSPWKWIFTRIIEVMPDKDNKNCTCKLKTAARDVEHPISKVYYLPIKDN